jgi:peptidoglycan/xylan/chitin deacetylase (PgdA/CDA1 family)
MKKLSLACATTLLMASAHGLTLGYWLLLLGLTSLPLARASVISLTIDDLPAIDTASRPITRIADGISKTLKLQQVPATGFVTGKRAEAAGGKEALEVFAKAGIALANHTWSHQRLSDSEIRWFLNDIKKVEAVIDPLARRYGPWPKMFRFPTLDQGNTPKKIQAMNGYFQNEKVMIGHVSLDTSDWAFSGYYQKFIQVGNPLQAQGLLALYAEHVLDCLSYAKGLSIKLFGREIPLILLVHANALNMDALSGILSTLKSKGHSFVSLSEALEDAAYRPYLHELPFSKGDHFLRQMELKQGTYPETPDRTSYQYFRSHWEPRIKRL